ncbi:MAG TPA: Hsp20/alpha crystallin family protein [Gemmatimonadota bacterium]|nr:Hsp20/alpha crystallin family protein [Gemmatimonadota bacterium]
MNEKDSETEKGSEASGRGALAEFKEAVGNLFESVVGLTPDFGLGREWPRHELVVEDDTYRVLVELPGFSRDEVEVSVASRVLTVSGERKKFQPPADARLLRSERPSGTFEISVRVPAEVDALGVVAQMHNGVLEIRLPKSSNRGRSIEIEETSGDSGPADVKRKTADEMPWEGTQASGTGDTGEGG